MKGTTWSVIVFAIFAGLILPAVNLTAGTGTTTTNLESLFGWIAPVAGVFIIVVTGGAFLNFFSGGGF